MLAILSRNRRKIARHPTTRLHAMTWGLALFPLLFVPPLAAMAIAWRAPSQRSPEGRFDPTWITIAAIFNLAISASVIHRFGPDLSTLMARGQHMLGAPSQTPVSPGLRSI